MTALIIALALLAVLILVFAVILFGRIKTMSRIRYIGGRLHTVDYCADYKLDKLLARGVKDVPGLMSFLSKEIYFGYPIKVNEQICGCTSLAAKSPDGKLLVGRNFDYPPTGMLLVYTKPKNAYASYSMVCLAHLDISSKAMLDSLMGKAMILCAPFACVDGLNEKGLHVSVLELSTTPTAQDKGKPDIITTVAVRMLLDKCATTTEAIEMLGQYDMFSSAGSPYHFFITDRQNNTVVVEWPDPEQEMVVLNLCYATNFQLAEGKDKGVGIGHDRYKIVAETLEKSQGILTENETMKLLEAAKVEFNNNWGTLWSIVYNVSDFSLKMCCDMEYDKVYEFSKNI